MSRFYCIRLCLDCVSRTNLQTLYGKIDSHVMFGAAIFTPDSRVETPFQRPKERLRHLHFCQIGLVKWEEDLLKLSQCLWCLTIHCV